MPRNIPADLQTHLDGAGTTVCFLLRITTQDGTKFGVTSLDVDVPYDDGEGLITYQAIIGLNQSAIATSAGLDVDNSEAQMLIADSGDFTAVDIETGKLDYANFVVYRVNWKDLTARRHYTVQTGTTGAVKQVDGLLGVIELRGLPQGLKQNFVDLYSLTCRARFGSVLTDEPFPCNFDAVSLWQNLGVLSVGTETDRVFTADATPAATGPNGALGFEPALVEWLTGTNAGLTSEVEELVGDTIALRFPTPFPIVDTDTFKIRPDCGKRFTEDCKASYDNILNFRGEPLIPLGDESSVQTPGAGQFPIKLDRIRNNFEEPGESN